jgi:hemolysin III
MTEDGGEMPGHDGRPAGLSWNYDRAEIVADGIVHAVGVGLGLAGAVFLLFAAHIPRGEAAPVAIYAAGLLVVLGLSAAYNMWPVSPVKWLLRRFDHAAIYVLIAGTYTPFLAQAKIGLTGPSLLIFVWLTAFVGAVLKLAYPGRFDRFAIPLYLALGWSGIVAYRPLVAALPSSILWLLAAGGILYSAGVAFHLWERLRFQNAIWHAFVVAAACCHYAAVLEYTTIGS